MSEGEAYGGFQIIYSPIAQSVERVTVNHDVVGSSPTWGAKKMKDRTLSPVFYFARFYGWTRKADKENNLNGCFPAVAACGESNKLKVLSLFFSF